MEKVAYGRSIDEFVCAITDTEKGKGKNLSGYWQQTAWNSRRMEI
jgi:hypothetical protein